MARGEEREISIFNMSFLDVFCCTVGALIFILFIQILRTRDMVERQELQKIQASLAEAKKELDSTKEEITDAEKQLGKIRGELKVARAESEKKDTIIENLKKRLQTPQSPSSNREFADLPNQASSSTTQESRWAMEAQKTARGQFLLGNLETRPIVCSGKGLYFGMSREAVSVGNNLDIKPLFREFLRFYDARQEGLWRTIWGDGVNAYNLSIQLQLSESAYIGKGLVTQKELLMQQAQQIAASKGTATVDMDTDHDGKAETRFEDSDGDGKLDVKRVNIDSDPFFEEIYLNYDAEVQQWDLLLVDSDGDNQHDNLYQDTQPMDSDYEIRHVLPNLQTGNAMLRYEDTDNDGVWDTKYENTDMTNNVWEKTYMSFNVRAQRWGAISVDTNGDGKADVVWQDTDMSNDDWEEKLVDENGDGVWDLYWRDLDARDNDWEAKLSQPVGLSADIWRKCELDSDADGVFDTMLEDTDNDGEWNQEYSRDLASGQWVQKR